MRRFIIAALFSAAAVTAGAQTFSEALTYSTNEYFGTARSLALGGAMTALGGDLGSIGINPAGSAVGNYSQFTISPGVSIMANTSGYSTAYSEEYGNFMDTNRSRFTVPNIGFTLKLDTYENAGLKSFTVGVLANSTSQYLNDFTGSGVNDNTSLLASFGAAAAGYLPSDLNNFNNFFDSSIPWNYLLGYQSGMIAEAYDEYGNPIVDDQGNYTYLGTTELMTPKGDGTYDIRTAGPLDQYTRVQTMGSKSDIIINLGMNFSDNFFFGVNMGMPCATYTYSEYFREGAVDPSQFAIEYTDGQIANFSHATYDYHQTTDISGIFAKFGAIWIPFSGLRLGAAVQTPTLMTITDSWDIQGRTCFTVSDFDSACNSPLNDYSYNLSTPWRFNLGAALTFGRFGLVSADFETCDYSSMRFSTLEGGPDYFSVENDVNRNFAGREYEGRFGAEIKLLPQISLRAGYTVKTSSEYNAVDKNGVTYTPGGYLADYSEFKSGRNWFESKTAVNPAVNSYSAGIGYSSNGSFFADFAVRSTRYPTKYYNPYSDYITGGDEYLPEVSYTRTLTTAVLTLGWRF